MWGGVVRILCKVGRVMLPGRGKHRGQPSRQTRREAIKYDEQWILDLLPPTPRAPEPAEPAEAWAPRITRWVRVACPLPDDTILLPVPAAAVLQLMARGFAWDPS